MERGCDGIKDKVLQNDLTEAEELLNISNEG